MNNAYKSPRKENGPVIGHSFILPSEQIALQQREEKI